MINEIRKVLEIFKASNGHIRPHHIIVGPSGSGKSHTVETLVEELELDFLEINAAQLTKEGTSGNSLSKALAPIQQKGDQLVVVFVDEFDKLFISGNSNSQLAHETTNGVQNEFLKILESDTTQVFGEYGKYNTVSVKNALFVFAGAFNGEEEVTLDRLRDFGVKTEFLGRTGLVFNLKKLTIDEMLLILEDSILLKNYLKVFEDVAKKEVVKLIGGYLRDTYEQNTIGARLINTLIHQYFIQGGKLGSEKVKEISFQTTLKL